VGAHAEVNEQSDPEVYEQAQENLEPCSGLFVNHSSVIDNKLLFARLHVLSAARVKPLVSIGRGLDGESEAEELRCSGGLYRQG